MVLLTWPRFFCIWDVLFSIIYMHVKTIFEGAREDGDSVAETNLPGSFTYFNGLIFVGKEHTT